VPRIASLLFFGFYHAGTLITSGTVFGGKVTVPQEVTEPPEIEPDPDVKPPEPDIVTEGCDEPITKREGQ
jgi:hypothetical protein